MGSNLDSGYKKAFDSVCDRITGGSAWAEPGAAALLHGTPSDGRPAPDALVKLYTDTLQTGRKKRSGIFYTPPEVVRFMCRDSLAHYLSNSTGLSFNNTLKFLDNITAEAQDAADIDAEMVLRADRALETIRVFDPAAGCGAFICGMLDEIVRIRSGISRHIFPGRHPFILKYNAVVNSIHGTDIDATAVEITRLRLWYELITEFERYTGDVGSEELIDSGPSDFRCSVTCADSLFEHDACGFDVIIGNPPYISAVEASKSDRGMRRALKKKYPQLKGAFDIYAAFLLDGIRRLNEKGVYCWIVPNKLLVSQYAAPVLQRLRENGLRYTISISDLKVFSGVGVYPIIVTGNRLEAGSKSRPGASGGNAEATRCDTKESGESTTDSGDPHRPGKHTTEDCSSATGFCEYTAASLQQLHARCFVIKPKIKQYQTLADYGIKIASGAAGFQARILKQYIRDMPYTANTPAPAESDTGSAIPFAVSGSIDRYRLDRSKVRYMGTTYKNPYIARGEKIADSKWELWCRDKICIAGMARELEAYFSREPLALGVGAYAIYDFGGMDPFYLLALLNSRFMSWFLREKFYERHLAGGYLAINKFILEQLPVVRADEKTEKDLAGRAEKLQQIFRGGADVSSRDTADSVYDRYGSGDLTHHIRKNATAGQCHDAETDKLLREIDELVYMIYGLDSREADRIRNESSR